MPPKRQKSSRNASTSRRRISVASTPIPENQPLYSADEKRQLILAHAAMRAPHDPVQMMSAWAGVAIALLVIAAGWWWATGTVILNTAGSIGPGLKEALQDAPSITQEKAFGTIDIKQAMKEASDKLRVMNAEASTRQQALEHMAKLVASSTSDVPREDFFKPSVTSSTTSASSSKP